MCGYQLKKSNKAANSKAANSKEANSKNRKQ
jgi:hypothetical protein